MVELPILPLPTVVGTPVGEVIAHKGHFRIEDDVAMQVDSPAVAVDVEHPDDREQGVARVADVVVRDNVSRARLGGAADVDGFAERAARDVFESVERDAVALGKAKRSRLPIER